MCSYFKHADHSPTAKRMSETMFCTNKHDVSRPYSLQRAAIAYYDGSHTAIVEACIFMSDC